MKIEKRVLLEWAGLKLLQSKWPSLSFLVRK
jgi:hypothetical protein